MKIPGEEELKDAYRQTMEQKLLVRRLELEADAQGCSQEFTDLVIGLIEYYQIRENWCMEQVRKTWGL